MMEIQQATPVLHYSRSYAAEQAAEAAANPPEKPSRLNEAATRAVLGICMAAWAVIGLFLWIPRVLRAVVVFSVALVQATVSETTAEAAGRNLRSAANFYRRGFVSAVESIRPSDEDAVKPDKGAVSIESGLLVRETAWAIVTWYVILWLTGIIRGTSLDLAVVPWGGLWSSWVEAVWSVPALFGL